MFLRLIAAIFCLSIMFVSHDAQAQSRNCAWEAVNSADQGYIYAVTGNWGQYYSLDDGLRDALDARKSGLKNTLEAEFFDDPFRRGYQYLNSSYGAAQFVREDFGVTTWRAPYTINYTYDEYVCD